MKFEQRKRIVQGKINPIYKSEISFKCVPLTAWRSIGLLLLLGDLLFLLLLVLLGSLGRKGQGLLFLLGRLAHQEVVQLRATAFLELN